jgi:hypothetical protein
MHVREFFVFINTTILSSSTTATTTTTGDDDDDNDNNNNIQFPLNFRSKLLLLGV